MSPRYDHRGPAVAFVVLFLVAVLVMGDQMLARAVGGTTFLAFDRAPRVLLAVRPAPREARTTAPMPAVPPLMAVVASTAPTVHADRPARRTVPLSGSELGAQHTSQVAASGADAQAVRRPGRRLGERAARRATRPHHPQVRATVHTVVAHVAHRPVVHPVAHGAVAHRVTPPGLVRSVRQHPAVLDPVGPHRFHRPAGHALGWARGHHGHGAKGGHRR